MDKRKLTKEDIDKVRDIEGFPIGTDEDIIALSDAPYYTACPNPFIEDFIRENGKPYDEATDDYHREPFAADVSEGKSDPIYNSHSYHTKVPYKAIMRYILHYTNPGDIVLDGFCGSGMTGVAAQMCESPAPNTKLEMKESVPNCQWGYRKTIIGDLSPFATLLSRGNTSRLNAIAYTDAIQKVVSAVKEECGWMYQTNAICPSNSLLAQENRKGTINYIVWSDVLVCPHCGNEIVFWDAALDKKTKNVSDVFSCPKCGVRLKKVDCSHSTTTYYDKAISSTCFVSKQVPVLINYSFEGKR